MARIRCDRQPAGRGAHWADERPDGQRAQSNHNQRTVPGAFDVGGVAEADFPVLIHGVAAARQGARYHRAVPVENSAAGVWTPVLAEQLKTGGGAPSPDYRRTLPAVGADNHVFVPKTPEGPVQDADGNQTQDGRKAKQVARLASALVDLAAKLKGWIGNRLLKIPRRKDAPPTTAAALTPGFSAKELVFSAGAGIHHRALFPYAKTLRSRHRSFRQTRLRARGFQRSA